MRYFVFKPKRRNASGRSASGKYWHGCIVDDEGREDRFSLRVTDKRVAEQRLMDEVTRRERIEAGLTPSPDEVRRASMSMTKHLKDYLADMTAKQRSPEHTRKVKQRIGRLITDLQWHTPTQVTADSFQQWRGITLPHMSPKTSNEYLSSMSAFLKWLCNAGRIEANPLASVQRINLRGVERGKRRSLTDEEVARLLALTGERSIVYLTALRTGLRHGELKKLQWRDLDLD